MILFRSVVLGRKQAISAAAGGPNSSSGGVQAGGAAAEPQQCESSQGGSSGMLSGQQQITATAEEIAWYGGPQDILTTLNAVNSGVQATVGSPFVNPPESFGYTDVVPTADLTEQFLGIDSGLEGLGFVISESYLTEAQLGQK